MKTLLKILGILERIHYGFENTGSRISLLDDFSLFFFVFSLAGMIFPIVTMFVLWDFDFLAVRIFIVSAVICAFTLLHFYIIGGD